jgi:hypothetical protein
MREEKGTCPASSLYVQVHYFRIRRGSVRVSSTRIGKLPRSGLLGREPDEEVVMESTAQYRKPVWEALERYWKPIREKREGAGQRSGTLHLAQAQSNRGRQGRKRDFPDAERGSGCSG